MALSTDSTESASPRFLMRQFWQEHSKASSLEEMMLDSSAEELTQEDVAEILALMPRLKGLDVLELGAGIGRFTGPLADLTHHVTVVDFMESFVTHNQKENGHRSNVVFLQADVTSLELPSQSFDLIFSNWLFMYLSDAELSDLAQKMLSWLRPGGHLFFRESCFHQSGDSPRAFNPTLYRSPKEYNRLLTATQKMFGDKLYGFEIVLSRSVQTYIKEAKQESALLASPKVPRNSVSAHGYDTFQQFLDSEQYAVRSLQRYEWVFGPGFVSTGGIDTTKELLSMLALKPGQKVLDVGCGVGGGDFYMAKKFGGEVLGLDLSHNMVELALERAQQETESLVQFEIGDATRRVFPEGSFDIVYSRDTILHVADKSALFQRFLLWLKPGGKLLISDYCCGPRPWSEGFTKYVEQRGYSLLVPQEYGQVKFAKKECTARIYELRHDLIAEKALQELIYYLQKKDPDFSTCSGISLFKKITKVLQEVGFKSVQALDHTERMLSALTEELQKLERNRESFVQEFSKDEFEAMASGWREKLERCADGDQRWGVFCAVKPLKALPQPDQ